MVLECIVRRAASSIFAMRHLLVRTMRAAQIYDPLKILAAALSIVVAGGGLAIAGGPMGTDGEVNVTRVGGATYKIPIEIPPGTAGVVPILSLAYSDHARNGLLGMGWSLDGLPSITRCGQTFAQDGKTVGVTLTAADRFCLAGQRLVATNGTYGADGTTYTTELDTFSKIVSHGAAGTGPAWFEMRTKDGQVLEFGHTSDSQILAPGLPAVSTWSVNKVADLVGNFYTVTYWQNAATGEARPTRIDYTGNAAGNVLPYNSVKFLYSSADSTGRARSDTVLSYRVGAVISAGSLLTNVQTFSGTTLVSDYRLIYNGANQKLDAAGRSLLNSVQRCDVAGACLAPTTFAYSQGELSKPYTVYLRAMNNTAVYTASFTGKGRDDVLWVQVNPVTGRPAGRFWVWLSDPLGTGFQFGQESEVGISGDVDVYLGDFGGTGRVDILFRGKTATSDGGVKDQWSLFASNGDGTFTPKPNPFAGQIFASDPEAHAVIGDFFGNGVSSILMENARTGSRFFIKGEGGYSFSWASISGLNNASMTSYAADFNGDGLSDLVLERLDPQTGNPTGVRYVALNKGRTHPGYADLEFSLSAIRTQLPSSKLFVGDFNGDGLADLLLQGMSNGVANGQFATLLSKGDGSFAETVWQMPNYSSYRMVGVARFSGTGFSDFLLEKTAANGLATGTRQIAVSKGDGNFVLKPILPDLMFEMYQSHIGDFTGTGSAGILYVSPWSGRDKVAVWPGGTYLSNLLSTVTTGLGATTSIVRAPFLNSDVYSPSSVYDSAHRAPIETQSAVLSIDKSDGVGGTRSSSFHYSGGVVEPTGRGFLGFDEVAVTDQATAITRRSAYTPAALSQLPWQGLPSSSTTVLQLNPVQPDVATQLIGATTFTYTAKQTSSITGRPGTWFPELVTTNATSVDLDGSPLPEQVTTNTYDCDQALPCYGNLTQSVTTIPGLTGYNSTTVNTYAPTDTTSWIVGRIAQTTVTNTLSAASAVRTNAFTHQPGTGLLASEIIEPANAALKLETNYGRDSFGNINAVSTVGADIVSRATSGGWSANGAFVSFVINALNQSSSMSVDPRFGGLTSGTDPNGLSRTAQYDTFGRLTLQRNPDGIGTSFSYVYCSGIYTGTILCPPLAAYLVQSTPVSASGVQIGAQTTQYFDIYDRIIQSDVQSFDGSLSRVLTQYDALGRVAKVSEPFFVNGGAPVFTTYTYDVLSRVTRVTYPDGSWDQRDYHGLTMVDTNSKAQTRTTTRNQLGQIATVKDTLGNTTSYGYDVFGNLTSVTDPAGNVTSYTYDLLGRPTGVSDPDAGQWTYAYNTAGELISQTDARGNTATFKYDLLGRATSRVEPDLTSTWTYDTQAKGIGKLATAVTNTGYQRAHAYDGLGRSSQTTLTIDGTSYTTTTSYDGAGRVGGITYPSGFAVSYLYNSLGYLNSLQNAVTSTPLWTANTSDAALRLTQETLGNGIVTNRSFDASTGRLQSIGSGSNNTVQNLSYAWDTLGNLTQRVDGTQGLTETFTYDTLDRLTKAEIAGGASKSYGYDTIGNIVSKSDVGTYSYPASGAGAIRPHAVTSILGTVSNGVGAITNPAYSYDANGNLTSGGGRSFTYTTANLPATITAGAVSLAFGYDSEHDRIKQTAPEGTTLYLNAGGAMVEKFTDSNGVVSWRNYLSVGGRMIGLRQEPASGPAQTLYFHKDHLNSVAVLTDDAGNVLERNSYDAWGKRRFVNGTDDVANAVTSRTIRGFTEQEHLGRIGLVHLNARFYDPQLGRFMTADPIGLNGGANLYRYAANNPLSLVDTRGTEPIHITIHPPWYYAINASMAETANGVQRIGNVGVPGGSNGSFVNGIYVAAGSSYSDALIMAADTRATHMYGLLFKWNGSLHTVYGVPALLEIINPRSDEGRQAQIDKWLSSLQRELISARVPEKLYNPCQAECQAQRQVAFALQSSRSPAAVATIVHSNAELGAGNLAIPGVGGNQSGEYQVAQKIVRPFESGGGAGINQLIGPNVSPLTGLSRGLPSTRAPSLSPPGAGRQGAFNEAKRQNGIPTSQQPAKTSPNVDKRGNLQPGRAYDFEVPAEGGGTRTIRLRDDAAGHVYRDDPSQNRGPHFNDPKDGHYEY